MKIRDFELYLISDDRNQRQRFQLQTRCVTALYERCFPGLRVERCWKVLIECVEAVKRADVLDFSGVFTCQVAFDYREYERSGDAKRKQMALEAIHAGAMSVAEQKKWPKEPFEAARSCVLERAFRNEWTWPRAKWNPARTHQVMLVCLLEMSYFRAWLTLRDRRGREVGRELVIEEQPSEFLFVPKMGKVVWDSSERAVLLDKRGLEVGEIRTAVS